MEGDHKPWWQDDPELKEILRRSFEEFEQELEQRAPAGPDEDEADPVVAEWLGGASWRELADARDELASARIRYDNAVRTARAAGLSWGEIGRASCRERVYGLV